MQPPNQHLSGRGAVRGAIPGSFAMILVGSCVAVSAHLATIPLLAGQAARYLIAALVLLVLAKPMGQPLVLPRGTEWFWVLAGALAGSVLFNLALIIGSQHADASTLGVGVACAPIALAVLGPLIRGERLSGQLIAAAILVSAGAVIVDGGGTADVIGILLTGVVLLCEAGFTLLAAPALPRMGAWSYSTAGTAVAAALFAALSIPFDHQRWGELGSVQALLTIGYLGAVGTAVAFVAWFTSVAKLGSATAGLVTAIAVPAAALIATLLGAPLPTAIGWLGMAVLGIGLAVGFLPALPAAKTTWAMPARASGDNQRRQPTEPAPD